MSKIETTKARSLPVPGFVRKSGDICPYCDGILLAHRGATTWYLRCANHQAPTSHMFYLSDEEIQLILTANNQT